MFKQKQKFLLFIGILFLSFLSADDNGGIEGMEGFMAPDVKASFSIGFNYDYLRSPLRHSFTRSRGLFSVNIPIPLRISDDMMLDLVDPVADNFDDGDVFLPNVEVKQFANTTIQVDVPMLGGVCSFNHVRMLNINYGNRISMPRALYKPDLGESTQMQLTAAMNVPLNFSLGWETLTFGYLYRFDGISDRLKAGLSLSRHHAYFDISGDVNIDVYGYADVEASGSALPRIIINYDDLHNNIDGYFVVERWTPTLSLQYDRFSFIARFGFEGRAKGRLRGDYAVPFFVDPETFQFNDSLIDEDMAEDYIIDNQEDFRNNRITRVRLNTNNDMIWEMPHGFTFGFDIVREKLNLSYTKFKNNVSLTLYDDKWSEEDGLFDKDTIDFHIRASVDHMILLKGNLRSLFFSAGVFSFDVGFGDEHSILYEAAGDVEKDLPLIQFGDGVLMPVLHGGIVVGQKFQVLGEIDIFPFPSIKTGVIYHF